MTRVVTSTSLMSGHSASYVSERSNPGFSISLRVKPPIEATDGELGRMKDV
jgi:hypothetical protein